jgi:hypothetical protein
VFAGNAGPAAESRREAAPAALIALLVFVVLALVSRDRGWNLLGLSWWVWLVLASPVALLTIDLFLTYGGQGLARSRTAALGLLGLLALGNFAALVILVAALVSAHSSDLTGGELLFTGFAIWIANVIVFGLWFWEFESGGPIARLRATERVTPDFQFPQDENPALAHQPWQPGLFDYVYIATTNSIAFSPTDAMPLTRRAKGLMAIEATVAAVTILIVAARAVNILR